MLPDFPKVIVGPACAQSLVTNLSTGLQLRFGNRFHLTSFDHIRFRDGDSLHQITENVRGRDVYLVHPANSDANFMYLMKMIDSALLASARSINVVFTYYPGRQDRKDRPRVGITAALLARLTQAAFGECGIKKVILFEPHCDQLEMAFNGQPCDKLWATSILLDAFEKKYHIPNEELTVGGPDAGSLKLVRKVAEILGLDFYFHGDKRRIGNDKMKIVNIVGDVKGKNILIRDDMTDTGGSLADCVHMCAERGALKAYAAIAHGILVDPAIDVLMEAHQKSILEHVFITDSVSNENRNLPSELFSTVSCGDTLAEAVYLNHTSGSLSAMSGMYKV